MERRGQWKVRAGVGKWGGVLDMGGGVGKVDGRREVCV